MILVVGGAGQGKRTWALARSGYGEGDCSPRLEDPAPILVGLEELVREALSRGEDPRDMLPALQKKEYVLCREVGCGVVPMGAEERSWREEVGRLCCDLCRRADGAARLCCGVAVWLKEPGGAR